MEMKQHILRYHSIEMGKINPLTRSKCVINVLRVTVSLFSLFFISGYAYAQKIHSHSTEMGNSSLPLRMVTAVAGVAVQTTARPSEIASFRQPSDTVGSGALMRSRDLVMTRDPKTGKVPEGIRIRELEFVKSIPRGTAVGGIAKSAKVNSSPQTWNARGPENVGGRTRALAIDLDNENIILAGAANGGMWRSEDKGATWSVTTALGSQQSVTCVVQDPRPGFHNIWYYGTGEFYGATAYALGNLYYGGSGIFKSIDGGKTWNALLASSDSQTQNQYKPLHFIFNLAISPLNGYLFVATGWGIYLSQDGGTSFSLLLESGVVENPPVSYGTLPTQPTDVMVTPSGVVYAIAPRNGQGGASTPFKDLYRSDNSGTSWKELYVFNNGPYEWGRPILAYAPSNENIIYCMLYDGSGLGNQAFIMKYTNGVPRDPVDLSASLPVLPYTGAFNLFGGYDMVLKVSPVNPNLVIFGGSNLYRTTDGFTTQVTEKDWIGGFSHKNDLSYYPGSHQDQHALVFFPSKPNAALVGNDGGVQITTDITTSLSAEVPVQWQPLNNGYRTSECYSVAINRRISGQQLLAGIQQNGTWFTESTSPSAVWTQGFSGDGNYCAMAGGGTVRYLSANPDGNQSNLTKIYRLTFPSADAPLNAPTTFSNITPSGSYGAILNYPFLLDDNEEKRMYLATGSVMWRNNNLDSIAYGGNATTTTEWDYLSGTQTFDGSNISAIALSRIAPSDRLYFGTASGQLFRLDSANLGTRHVPLDIGKGSILPLGYISGLAVDPSNGDNVLITFSNYNVKSIFSSTDGGISWTSVSGNLEQNPDGTGSGPSVRWITIVGNHDKYLVGTSQGIFSTTSLNADATVWQPEGATSLGNKIISMMQTRDDGFTAAATFGDGVYSTQYPVTSIPTPNLYIANPPSDKIFLPDGNPSSVDISSIFKTRDGSAISYSVFNELPDSVAIVLSGNVLTVSLVNPNADRVHVGLVARNGNERMAVQWIEEKMSLSKPLYEQTALPLATAFELPSQQFNDLGNFAIKTADVFTVPTGVSWKVTEVLAKGNQLDQPDYSNIHLEIYNDNLGKPGKLMFASPSTASSNVQYNSSLDIRINPAVVLPSGKFWLSVFPVSPYLSAIGYTNQWFWAGQTPLNGNQAYIKDTSNLLNKFYLDWVASSTLLGIPIQTNFSIIGEAVSPGQAATSRNALADLTVTAYPNPVISSFKLKYNGKRSFLSASIYDESGRQVVSAFVIREGTLTDQNMSGLPRGIYFLKIYDNTAFRIIKLLKN